MSLEFTVIIPTYNRQQKTERAIMSVLVQSALPIEVIVIDDGSFQPFTFQTPECGEGDVRNEGGRGVVRIIRHALNLGAAAARNTGMAEAKTEWITFLDSDDQLVLGTLQKRVDRIDPKRVKTIFGCGWRMVDENGRRLFDEFPNQAESPDDHFAGVWFCPGSCIFLNKTFALADAGPLNEKLRRYEDYEWFCKLSISGFAYEPNPVIGALIERSSFADTQIAEKNASNIRRSIGAHTMSARQFMRRHAYLNYEVGAAHFRARKYLSAASFLFISWLFLPRLTVNPLRNSKQRIF